MSQTQDELISKQDEIYPKQWFSMCGPRTLGGTHSIFMLILKCYLPISLLFSCEHTMEFSRSYMLCDISRDCMQKQI